MNPTDDLNTLSAEQLRTKVASLMALVDEKEVTIKHHRTREAQLTHELALLKRHRYGRRSEGMSDHQVSLLQEQIDEDMAAMETELAQVAVENPPKARKQSPKRNPLPPQLPRAVIRHEPDSTLCSCGCQMTRIGEDVSEKLDYEPGTFRVEQHVRGKWACQSCETITQSPVELHVIDRGIPTTGLLAQVLVSKYADHLPLYRQQQIYARAEVELSRSTLSDWVGRCGVELAPLVDRLQEILKGHGVLHADETPVSMLAPGQKKTHRAYVWAYSTTRYSRVQGVVYDFCPTRAGSEVRSFLEGWSGKLVCDDYSGYKASFGLGVTEIGCMAHARRKFHDLYVANDSPVANRALQYIRLLYDIERETATMDVPARREYRQEKAKPLLDKYRLWLIGQREKVTNGTATAKAIDYSLKRWDALTCYAADGDVPIDNNQVENQIRPWALGRSNWLFAGSLCSGQRAANIMSLIQSAKLNNLNPNAYLKGVMERLPTIRYSELDELLPHNWKAPVNRE